MSNIKKILAPTDLSELSREAVSLALEIGKVGGAKVTVYHVIEHEEASSPDDISCGGEGTAQLKVPLELIEERKRLLAAFIRDNFADLISDVAISQDVEVGTVYRKLLDRASEEKTDLIVISTHGKGGLLYALVGSVAEMVVRLACCPVLSVRPKKEGHQAAPQAA